MRPYLKFASLVTVTLLAVAVPVCPLSGLLLPAIAQTSQDGKVEGDRLLKTAKQHYRRAEFKQAIAHAQQALTQAQQMGDRSSQIEALLQLGDIDLWIYNISQAETKGQQALKLSREIKDRTREGFALALLGDVYRNQQQYAKAMEVLQEALTIAQSLKDRKLEARSRFYMGAVLYGQAQYPKALKTLQQALKISQDINEQDETASILAWIALTYSSLKDFNQAEIALQQQQKLSQSIGSLLQEYAGLTAAAFARQEQKQPDKALQTQQQALAISQATDNPWFTAQMWSGIGHIQDQQDRYPQAIQAYQKALTLYQELNRLSDQVNMLSLIGNTYTNQGAAAMKQQNFAQAHKLYEQALISLQISLEVAQKNPEQRLARDTQFYLARVYYWKGNLAELEGHYQTAINLKLKGIQLKEQALTSSREIKDAETIKLILRGISGDYLSIARAYQKLKQFRPSLAALQKAEVVAKEAGDPDSEKLVLQNYLSFYMGLANSYNDPIQNGEKLEANQQLLSIATKLNDPYNEAIALVNIAQIYRFQGKYTQAIAAYQQALTRARAAHNPQYEYFALSGLGLVYSDQANFSQAIEAHEKALQVSRQPNLRQNTFLELSALNNIGVIYEVQGKYAQALASAQKILESSQKYYREFTKGVTLETVQAICLKYYNSQNTPPEIQALASESWTEMGYCTRPTQLPTGEMLKVFQIRVSTETRLWKLVMANQFGIIGNIYTGQGKFQNALEFKQKALAIFREIRDRGREAETLDSISSTQQYLGDYAKALDLVQQALKIAREQDDRVAEATYLSSLCEVKRDTSYYAEALDACQKALTITQQLGQRYQESLILNQIATIRKLQGKYAESIKYYQKALEIRQEINVPAGIGTSLSDLGLVYAELGQYDQAFELHQQALTIYQKFGLRPSEATMLGNIGSVYRRQRQFDQALKYYQQSLDLARTIGYPISKSKTLVNLARVYLQQSQPEKALVVLQQAIVIQRAAGNRSNEADTLSLIGQAQTQLDHTGALMSLQQAVALAHEIGNTPIEAQALSHLGQLFTKNQPELAIVFYKQAVNLTETIRQDMRALPREQQESYTQTVAGTYRALADLLLSQGRIGEAQQVLELLKIQELRDYNRDTRAGNTPESIALDKSEEAIIKAHTTLIAFTQNIQRCYDDSNCANSKRLEELTEQRKQQNTAFANLVKTLEAHLKQRVETDVAFINPNDPNNDFRRRAEEIINSQPGTLLIYPLVLENKMWLLVGSTGAVFTRYEVNVSQKELAETILQFRSEMKRCETSICTKADTHRVKQISAKLYRWMFPEKLQKELQANVKQPIQNLVFAPDRSTRYIPMNSLFDGEKYLIERYTVSTIVAATKTDPGAKLPIKPKVLAMGLSDAVAGFNALPGVPVELDTIVKTAQSKDTRGIFPGNEFLNQTFTRSKLQVGLPQHQILHLATHGKFEPGAIDSSFLVLGDGNPFKIPDIQNLDGLTGVHLVVLSACETALGDRREQDGIEIAGISNAFLQRGAKSVIASLWQVNDPSTSLWMQRFYQNLAHGTLTKSQAMQQVQLDFLNGKITLKELQDLRASARRHVEGGGAVDLTHPYYWAPFILIGNGL